MTRARPAPDRPADRAGEGPFLRLLPRPVPRPWGGRRVSPRFGFADVGPCGEWWLASSYPGSETALAEGGLDLARWLDGPGRRHGLPAAADFPLLVKFLDCDDVLSVQVHPDDAVAARHGQPRGKTEAWHVLAAEPGAQVWLGTAPGVTCARLLDAAARGCSDAEMAGLLASRPVRAGQTLLVPAGTIHAIGKGLLLYEIQQNSDATYRIHDWGRGRALHLDRAREASRDEPPPAALEPEASARGWTRLVDGPAFRLLAGVVDGSLPVRREGAFLLLTVLAGEGRLLCGGRDEPLRAGETLLLLEPGVLSGRGLAVLAAGPA